MIRAKRGFTLVEMMIVLVIIGIIAAFAIPSMLESRTSANESGAEKALRTIVDAEATFYKTDYDMDGKNYSYHIGGAGTGLSNLSAQLDGNGQAINLIDPVLAGGLKEGYIYGDCADYNTVDADRRGFAYYAVPEVYKQTGRKSYVVSSDGVMYYMDTGSNAVIAGFPGATPAAMAAAGWIQVGT